MFHMSKKRVHIVLTGGSCSGKSTVLNEILANPLSEQWRTIVLPEAATLVFRNTAGNVRDKNYFQQAQNAILDFQQKAVEIFGKAYEDHDKVLFLHDRATIDNQAYLGKAWLEETLETKYGSSIEKEFEKYDAVIHMETAAMGNEKFYELNDVRYETPDEARKLDTRILEAWSPHPAHYVVGLTESFDDKIHQVRTIIQQILDKNF